MHIQIKPIWFDSLGAKSSCTLVKTPDISVLIDPGVAVMQPSFPAPWHKKIYWLEKGELAIKRASKEANVIIISHYHYDHYSPDDMYIYKNKILFVKNPNEYINDSQRRRAEEFFDQICQTFGKVSLSEILKERVYKTYIDPMKELPLAAKKDFGKYNPRRKELLSKGRRWFMRRANNWNNYPRIPESKFGRVSILYPEGKEFNFGKTKLRFTHALFHGIEFSRVGWVFSTVIEYEKEKFIHSSDLDGPIIEDYAEWLIRENPDVLILDGPATYLIPYMMNLINLKRAIENICKIVRRTDIKILILDHHLLREKKYKERLMKVYKTAKERNKKVISAAEYLGKEPIIEHL